MLGAVQQMVCIRRQGDHVHADITPEFNILIRTGAIGNPEGNSRCVRRLLNVLERRYNIRMVKMIEMPHGGGQIARANDKCVHAIKCGDFFDFLHGMNILNLKNAHQFGINGAVVFVKRDAAKLDSPTRAKTTVSLWRIHAGLQGRLCQRIGVYLRKNNSVGPHLQHGLYTYLIHAGYAHNGAYPSGPCGDEVLLKAV